MLKRPADADRVDLAVRLGERLCEPVVHELELGPIAVEEHVLADRRRGRARSRPRRTGAVQYASFSRLQKMWPSSARATSRSRLWTSKPQWRTIGASKRPRRRSSSSARSSVQTSCSTPGAAVTPRAGGRRPGRGSRRSRSPARGSVAAASLGATCADAAVGDRIGALVPGHAARPQAPQLVAALAEAADALGVPGESARR